MDLDSIKTEAVILPIEISLTPVIPRLISVVLKSVPILIAPVLALISIVFSVWISNPPLVAFNTIESLTASLEVKLIEVAAVISISSPAVFPEEVISIPPIVALSVIASEVSSVDFKLID